VSEGHGENAATPGLPGVIVALDSNDRDAALGLAARLDPRLCRLKVASTLFVGSGPAIVEALSARGFEVFLDLKFHDIPEQVARACRAAAACGAWMINVHAAGGRRMMGAAVEALGGTGHRPLLVAVTVLTSLDERDWSEIGMVEKPAATVARWTRLAAASGLDGVVCSAEELALLRTAAPESFLWVTPGIRPAGSGRDDQRRVVTPGTAARAGASYLVVGRPVTGAEDPMAAVAAIVQEIAASVDPG